MSTENQNFIELYIKTHANHAYSISDQLSLFGAQAVTFKDAGDEPIYEPPLAGLEDLWPETIVIGLFEETVQLDDLYKYLEDLQATGSIENFHFQTLAHQNWERICLEYFKPLQFGQNLWICPSWHTPPDPRAINIILDPGLAFGTGTHPTTALCLEWLEENLKKTDLVIDYGCGSGILSLAAKKLGAKQVIAIDNDPQAIEATHQNAAKNSVKIETYLAKDFNPEKLQADVLIANILARPLIELAPRFAELTHPNSQILLSGILAEQALDVKKAYSLWFNLDQLKRKNEWIRLAGNRF